MHVVAKAMITSIVNMRADRIPRSKPMLSAISSTNPRVFINAPSAKESGQSTPARRAANMLPPSFQRQANHPPIRVVQQSHPGPQARERKKQRQQENRTEVFQPHFQVFAELAAIRHRDSRHERAEQRVNAHNICGQRGRQQKHQHAGCGAVARIPALTRRAAD